MPTYDYRCKACDHSFELVCRIAEMEDALAEPCPSCNKKGKIVKEIAPVKGYMESSMHVHNNRDSKFKRKMQQIRKAHPNNTIPDY